VACGSCVVDLLCRPADLDEPIGRGVLHEVGPLEVTAGGIVSNSGIAMSRLGMKVGAFSYVGRDAWGPVVRQIYESEGMDHSPLAEHPSEATSTTVVMIDSGGERSFFHCVGAPRTMSGELFESNMDLFSRSRMMLLGYYSLMPNLEPDLPQVLSTIRARGCKTAMDAAGAGGTMDPLAKLLPHLDVYVPSLAEASHQVGTDDPQAILRAYREAGAMELIGVKLGTRGVLLSPSPGEFVEVGVCEPPDNVVDTTGAGDSFYAGLLTGLLKGLSPDRAGRLGAAAAACCVTALGGNAGVRDYDQTARLAGLN